MKKKHIWSNKTAVIFKIGPLILKLLTIYKYIFINNIEG